MAHSLVKRHDALWRVAPIVEERDLPGFGIRRDAAHARTTAYYAVRGTVTACCGAKTAAVIEIEINLPGGEGLRFVATARIFDHALVHERCWFCVAVHEGPPEGPHRVRRLHYHVLKVFQDFRMIADSEDVAWAA